MGEAYKEIVYKLVESQDTSYSVAAGFDGFIDLLVKPVRQIVEGQRQYFSTIKQMGEYISSKAGLSCSLDMDRLLEKAGGNMPLFGAALSAAGVMVEGIGCVGYPEVQEKFVQMGSRLAFTGVANPGSSTSLEFEDGKVMMASNGDVDLLDFELLLERTGLSQLQQWISEADGVAFLNWSEMPHSTSIWQGMLQQVLPSMPAQPKRWLLFDVSDCSRRTAQEIVEMAQLMRRFTPYFRVAFSLNYNELQAICAALGLSCSQPETGAAELARWLEIPLLTLHLLDGAVVVQQGKSAFVQGNRVAKPIISTGGGDNFNAGLMWGLLAGLDGFQAVRLANAVSCLYVQNGKSPAREEVIAYLTTQMERNECIA